MLLNALEKALERVLACWNLSLSKKHRHLFDQYMLAHLDKYLDTALDFLL
jgi:hypothetical protein